MLKKISELFCYRDGRLNAAKIWLHIGNTTATGIVIELAYKNTLSVDFFIAYMAIVTGASIANKYLNKGEKIPSGNNPVEHPIAKYAPTDPAIIQDYKHE